jgi:2-hydroxycyclohexanecarboxyl-CoA dehydrogenase
MSGFRGLARQRVLLTGAASGIGRAIALRLASEGVAVGVLDRDAMGAHATCEQAAAAGGLAVALCADLTDEAAVKSCVARFRSETFGGMLSEPGIAGLVNNAGWDRAGSFLETDSALWRQIVEINLLGVLHVTHAVLGEMASSGRGRVVTIASDAGRVGSSGEAVYAACKAGVIALMKSLAREHARGGITFNAVSPGPSDTPLFASFDPTGKLAAALERAIPMRRLGRPDDYPGIVAFLLSDDAAFITGQVISVSGGLTMHG